MGVEEEKFRELQGEVTLTQIEKAVTRTFPWYTLPDPPSPDLDLEHGLLEVAPAQRLVGYSPDYEERLQNWSEAVELLKWSEGDTEKVLGPMIDYIVSGNVRVNIVDELDPPGKVVSIGISDIPVKDFVDRVFPALFHNGFGPLPGTTNKDTIVMAWMAKQLPDKKSSSPPGPGYYL